ncbi:MAG: response regulator [Desulfovibrio sp.]|jgi:CheY-like chemotaxis protein|nr:response regulator [Desulfovibrio sp.]
MSEAGGDYPRLSAMFTSANQISAARFNDEDGTDSVVYFRQIFNGWHIGVIIPRIRYYSDVFALAAVLGVQGLFLASVLCYLLIRSLAAKVRSEEESLSKSTFLARMSHEIRTPMNAIIGMADIAQASSDPEKKKYCLIRISDASNHLLGIIEGTAAPEAEEGGNRFDPAAAQGQLFAGNRLLLAEDVVINREILITLLENTGVLIDSAENGREACAMFAAAPGKYDMIFMDIHMPEMDGYEATRCIRGMNLPRAGTIPIVAMTANVFREDIERCRVCGMDDHVGKPLEMGEVLVKMRKYMSAGSDS